MFVIIIAEAAAALTAPPEVRSADQQLCRRRPTESGKTENEEIAKEKRTGSTVNCLSSSCFSPVARVFELVSVRRAGLCVWCAKSALFTFRSQEEAEVREEEEEEEGAEQADKAGLVLSLRP